MRTIDDIIKEIAAKHSVALGRDDPILMLHTINQILLQDSVKAQEQILDAFKSEMEGAQMRWSLEAKAKAQAVLTASLQANSEALARAVQDGSKDAVRDVLQAIQASSSATSEALYVSKRLLTISYICFGATLCIVAAGLFRIFH